MAKHVKNIEAELIRQNTELKQEVHELKQTILLLEEQVAFLTKKIYGQSSERINSDQLSLFGQSGVFTEPEQTGNQSEETYQVITKIRSKKKTRKQTISPDLPVQDVLIPFDASQCPHGHSDWLIVGKKFVRQEVCYEPGRLYVKRIYIETGTCSECERQTGLTYMFQSQAPHGLLAHSPLSASLAAHVISDKFLLDLPLYRQQRALKQGGFNVSEGTLANWIIKTSQLIEPLYGLIHRELIARHHLQGDETPIQVINEPGRAAKSRSYMWVATIPLKLTNRIVYYAYSQTRAGSFAQKQLYNTYQGVLQCDGYAGYNLLGDQAIQRVGCWAHVRRKFKDAFDADKQYAETPLRLINSMFRLEKTWQHFSPRVRRRRRRSKIRPLLKRFWQWVDHYDGLAKSRLGKAVTYAADQRMYLSRIVNDGTMDWSNNTAERTMKSLVIGRKNWLFSTSPEGARSTAIWMTIVESAKANHIDPTKYIEYILLGVAQLPTFPKKEQLAAYLPWNFKESDLEAVKRAQAGVLIPDKNEDKNAS